MTRIRSCPTVFSCSTVLSDVDVLYRRVSTEQGDGLLLRQLETRILAGDVPSLDRYLALRTQYRIAEWVACPASLENKRRLCWWLMQEAADSRMVQHVFEGGLVYACPDMTRDFAEDIEV